MRMVPEDGWEGVGIPPVKCKTLLDRERRTTFLRSRIGDR